MKAPKHRLEEFPDEKCREMVREYLASAGNQNELAKKHGVGSFLYRRILEKGGLSKEERVRRGGALCARAAAARTRHGRNCIERDRAIVAARAEMPRATMSRIAEVVEERTGMYVCRRTVMHCLERLSKGRVASEALPGRDRDAGDDGLEYALRYEMPHSPWFVGTIRQREDAHA